MPRPTSYVTGRAPLQAPAVRPPEAQPRPLAARGQLRSIPRHDAGFQHRRQADKFERILGVDGADQDAGSIAPEDYLARRTVQLPNSSTINRHCSPSACKAVPKRVQRPNDDEEHESLESLGGVLFLPSADIWIDAERPDVVLPRLPQFRDASINVIVAQDVRHSELQPPLASPDLPIQSSVFKRQHPPPQLQDSALHILRMLELAVVRQCVTPQLKDSDGRR